MGANLSKKRVAFIGYGQLGRQIENFLVEAGFDRISFIYFDDLSFEGEIKNSFPFLDYTQEEYDDCLWVVSLGYKNLAIKSKIIKSLIDRGRSLLSVIHQTAYVHPSAKLGEGITVYPGCIIDQNVSIANGVLLNCGVVVSHDSIIQKSTFIAPGVIISGNVEVGEECFLGAGTIVSNNVKVGNSSVVGIGSVITKDLPAETTAIGNPIQIKQKLNIE